MRSELVPFTFYRTKISDKKFADGTVGYCRFGQQKSIEKLTVF